MKKSILQKLYFGDLYPCERHCVKPPQYDEVKQKVEDIATHFEELLSPEEYEKFEKMQDLESEIDSIHDTDLFSYAFSLGAMMMIEVFGHIQM